MPDEQAPWKSDAYTRREQTKLGRLLNDALDRFESLSDRIRGGSLKENAWDRIDNRVKAEALSGVSDNRAEKAAAWELFEKTDMTFSETMSYLRERKEAPALLSELKAALEKVERIPELVVGSHDQDVMFNPAREAPNRLVAEAIVKVAANPQAVTLLENSGVGIGGLKGDRWSKPSPSLYYGEDEVATSRDVGRALQAAIDTKQETKTMNETVPQAKRHLQEVKRENQQEQAQNFWQAGVRAGRELRQATGQTAEEKKAEDKPRQPRA